MAKTIQIGCYVVAILAAMVAAYSLGTGRMALAAINASLVAINLALATVIARIAARLAAPDDTGAPKWTPGPWRVRDEDGPPYADVMVGERTLASAYPEHYRHRDPEQQPAEAISRSYAEAEANARLIAAAPSLYDALSRLVARYHPYRDNHDDSDWASAVAALALARGGTP